jgi:predicted transport protein/Fe-S cluster assembly ATPase SufC
MKIKSLNIEGYKNLDIKLIHNSDIIALIGNNGSGKSNLLEALSLIFRSLYKKNETLAFNYFIEYTNIANQNIKIDKKKSKTTFKVDDVTRISIDELLPKKVVALYSGDEDRLWSQIYYPFYDTFVKDINRSKKIGIKIGVNQMPQMLYLNKFYWHISLLCLIISDSPDNQEFVKNVLKIKQVNRIKFDFVKSNYKEYSNSSVLEFIDKIDKKTEYSLEEFKSIIVENGYITDDVFKHLYIAFSPKATKIVSDIVILYNEHLTIEDFSEGEKKLLLIKAAFEFAEQEDSLFILDEPDAHIHLNNKEQIIKTFEPYKNNRQIVITTHSPTVTQAIQNDNSLFMINNGSIIERKKQEIIGDLADEFWNKHQQSSFLSSQKKIILLVEGKHDKIHIQNAFNKLEDEYPTLDFDIFSMNGACNIPQLITGLRTSDVKLDKVFIAVFDNDDEGKDNCNKTQVGYKNQITKLHKTGFFAIKYENDKKIGEGDGFTVENMFNSNHFENSYIEALQNHTGKFENKFIDKISKEIKDDAKSILSSKSKTFEKEDFINFRKLFDLILEIKTKASTPLVAITQETILEVLAGPLVKTEAAEITETAEKILPIFTSITNKKSGRKVTEAQHLKNKDTYLKNMYKLLKNNIVEQDRTIEVVSMVEYIAFKKNNKNIFDIKIQKNNIKLWVNKKNGTMPAVLSDLFDDVSNKGHHGNGDFEKTFTNEAAVRGFIVFDAISQILKFQ